MKSSQARALISAALLMSLIFLGPTIIRMAIVPGPEELDLKLYGVQFAEYSNTLWKLGEISNNQILEQETTTECAPLLGCATSDIQIKCAFPDPNNPVFWKDIKLQVDLGPLPFSEEYYTTLQIERRMATPSEVNIHGNPLGGDTGPTDVTYIEYHTPRVTDGNRITFKKYCIHVVPIDFVVQMSVRGDMHFGWSDTHLWFILQTTLWRTAFTERQVEQIQADLDRDPPGNATLDAYDFRGAFPLVAWIGEWDPLVWYDEEENENTPPSAAYDNVRFSPSLEGREATLYTEPSYTYDLDMKQGSEVSDPDKLKEILIGDIADIAALPDPDFATTVYTPIYLEKFYPYYEESGWGPWHRLEQWYPTTWMRIRVLYAVYGEFVYLWTEEEAEKYEYEWETRYSQYKVTQGPWLSLWENLGSFFMSPYGVLFMILTLGVIALIIVILINPAMVSAFLKRKGGMFR